MSELYVGTPNGVQKLGGEKELKTLDLGEFKFGYSNASYPDFIRNHTILDGENYEKIKNAKFVIVDIIVMDVNKNPIDYGQVMLINGKISKCFLYEIMSNDVRSVYNISINWSSENDCIVSSASCDRSTGSTTFNSSFAVYCSFSLIYFE